MYAFLTFIALLFVPGQAPTARTWDVDGVNAKRLSLPLQERRWKCRLCSIFTVTAAPPGTRHARIIFRRRGPKRRAAAGLYFTNAKPKPLFHAASEQDPLVKLPCNNARWTASKAQWLRNSGEAAEGRSRYKSKNGMPVVIYLHGEGHKYPEATPGSDCEILQRTSEKVMRRSGRREESRLSRSILRETGL